MTEYPIGPVSQIPRGEGRNFSVADHRIAVFHTSAGKIFATQATCPHRGGPLADGLIDQSSVICPLHDHMFSLATGEGIGNNCKIALFPTRIVADGTIVIVVGPK